MIDESRRAQLLSVKLATLVREHLGGQPELTLGEFGRGAALVADGAAWVLLDGRPERGLGPAIAWALRREATELNVLAERATGLLARRAAHFRFPISVWHVEGRRLLSAVAEPLPVAPPVPAAHDELRATILEAGATPMVEHGVLGGEVEDTAQMSLGFDASCFAQLIFGWLAEPHPLVCDLELTGTRGSIVVHTWQGYELRNAKGVTHYPLYTTESHREKVMVGLRGEIGEVCGANQARKQKSRNAVCVAAWKSKRNQAAA